MKAYVPSVKILIPAEARPQHRRDVEKHSMTKTGRETSIGRSAGIDLGTSNSVIAVLTSGGTAEVIPNAEGDRVTPSYVPYIFGGLFRALVNLSKDRGDITTERGKRIAKLLFSDISASSDLSPGKTQKKDILQDLEVALRNADLTLIEEITNRCLAYYPSYG